MKNSSSLTVKLCFSAAIALAVVAGGIYAANAETKPAEQAAPQFKSEEISVLGRAFTIMPYQELETGLSWQDAKKYLPANLSVQPVRAMSVEEITQFVRNAKLLKSAEQSNRAQELSDEYMKAHPEANREMVELMYAQEWKAVSSDPISKDLEKLNNEYIALTYLSTMLDDATRKPAQKAAPAP